MLYTLIYWTTPVLLYLFATWQQWEQILAPFRKCATFASRQRLQCAALSI